MLFQHVRRESHPLFDSPFGSQFETPVTQDLSRLVQFGTDQYWIPGDFQFHHPLLKAGACRSAGSGVVERIVGVVVVVVVVIVVGAAG